MSRGGGQITVFRSVALEGAAHAPAMHTWAALTATQWVTERKGRHEVRSVLRALRDGMRGEMGWVSSKIHCIHLRN